MKDSVRTAALLGGVGGLCGGCVSLLYLGFSAAAATLGLLFWGAVFAVPAAAILGVALYYRYGRSAEAGEACEIDGDEAGTVD